MPGTGCGRPTPQVTSLETLNAWLEQRCRTPWEEIPHGVEPASVAAAWRQEVDCLLPVLHRFVEETKRVSPTCLVYFDRNRYGMSASFTNRPVSLRIDPDRTVVVAEGAVVCEHQRIIE